MKPMEREIGEDEADLIVTSNGGCTGLQGFAKKRWVVMKE